MFVNQGGGWPGPRVPVNIARRMVGNGNGNQDVTAGTHTSAQTATTNYLRISIYFQFMQMSWTYKEYGRVFSSVYVFDWSEMS